MNLKKFFTCLTLLALSVSPFSLPQNFQSNIKIFFLNKASFPLKAVSFLLFKPKEKPAKEPSSKESNKLKKRIELLESQLIELEELRGENQRLREMLEFRQRQQRKVLPAFVIGRDPSNWSHSIIIDKGKSDNIKPDMPLITARGLVGKIVDVGKNSSRAILITDKNFKAGGIIQRTRMTGLVLGFSENRCQMRFIPFDADVQKEDVVITLGGGVFPKGILIGKIIDFGISSDTSTKYAIIELPFEAAKLEEVFVILSE